MKSAGRHKSQFPNSWRNGKNLGIQPRLIGSFHVKSTNPSHLTHMDFADILWSQCTHQEMKMLKILSFYHEIFQNYDRLNYRPSSLDNKPLQFLAFSNYPYSASFNSKHLKFWMGAHFLEVSIIKKKFCQNIENYTCSGVLKLSNWPLQYFLSYFHWAIPYKNIKQYNLMFNRST